MHVFNSKTNVGPLWHSKPILFATQNHQIFEKDRPPWAMRKRSNFRADFLSLPKASWGTSCTQHGPVRRRKSDPGGAPGPPRSVPGATPEAVWSQKAARNHPDPLETSILDHFGDDFGSFLLIFDPKGIPRTSQMTTRKSRNHFIRDPILDPFPTISTSKPSNRKASKLDID